jgi:hypothetical protein
MAVWYSLLSFGIFFPFWYACTKKNLATLDRHRLLRNYGHRVVALKMCFFFVAKTFRKSINPLKERGVQQTFKMFVNYSYSVSYVHFP